MTMDPFCDAFEQIKQLVLTSPDDCKAVIEQVSEIVLNIEDADDDR